MLQSRGHRSGLFMGWESMEYFSMAYVDRDDLYVQCKYEWQKSWRPAELFQVPNPRCFSYHSHMVVRSAADFGRHCLSAVARSEFVVLFLTCFWDAVQRGWRRTRVVDSGLKMNAPGRRFLGVLVPSPSDIGAALDSRANDIRDVSMRM